MTHPQDDLASIRRLKGELVDGSCKWLLGERKCHAWEVGGGPQLLWLQGNPSIGKTMASSFIAEQLMQKAQQHALMRVVYYFCDGKDESRNTALVILSGILLQLLDQRPLLPRHGEIDYDQIENRLSELVRNIDTLWTIIQKMVTDPEAGKVHVLVAL